MRVFGQNARLARQAGHSTRYEIFDYQATQAIAAAAHFLEFDGLKVPSARAPCSNLVFFTDRLADGSFVAWLASGRLG